MSNDTKTRFHVYTLEITIQDCKTGLAMEPQQGRSFKTRYQARIHALRAIKEIGVLRVRILGGGPGGSSVGDFNYAGAVK